MSIIVSITGAQIMVIPSPSRPIAVQQICFSMLITALKVSYHVDRSLPGGSAGLQLFSYFPIRKHVRKGLLRPQFSSQLLRAARRSKLLTSSSTVLHPQQLQLSASSTLKCWRRCGANENPVKALVTEDLAFNAPPVFVSPLLGGARRCCLARVDAVSRDLITPRASRLAVGCWLGTKSIRTRDTR